jgi:nitroreductase
MIESPERFFETRHSIRNFSDAVVDDTLLDRAVAMAIRSPSVCNRQPWQVRFLRGESAARARGFQNGNRGIEPLPVLAIVTVDSRMFEGRGERNQGWIEGGVFSASLMYAFHGLGLDSCMLNMSTSNSVARRLRSELGMDDYELVIMMIAIGYGADGARAPRSARREVRDVRID